MMFKSEKARNYLLQHGLVYSFRTRQRKIAGEGWVNEGYGKPKLADVFIAEIAHFEDRDEARYRQQLTLSHLCWFLEPYWRKSGFKNVMEWVEEIKTLNKGNLPLEGWLYLVKMLEVK